MHREPSSVDFFLAYHAAALGSNPYHIIFVLLIEEENRFYGFIELYK